MDARNMYRREINKYIEQNCASSWINLRDCTRMRGQQNIKYKRISAVMFLITDSTTLL